MNDLLPPPPPWLRPDSGLHLMPVGAWWDLIVIPTLWAETAALRLARRQGGLRPGPVIADQDQWEFLVPAGTSTAWALQGTRAYGTGRVLVPGHRSCVPPGRHWSVLPDPERPDRLVRPDLLAEVLTGRRS